MKRGISPLVGTILLIGFTIVLAALVFRWSGDFFQGTTEETGETIEEVLVLTGVDVDIINARASEPLVSCDGLELLIENKVEVLVDSFLVRITTSTETKSGTINESLDPFSSKWFNVDITCSGEIQKIELFPKVLLNDEILVPTEPIAIFIGEIEVIEGNILECTNCFPKLATVKHPCISTQEEVEDLSKYDLLVMNKRHSVDYASCDSSFPDKVRDLNPNIKILAHNPQSYIKYVEDDEVISETDIIHYLLTNMVMSGNLSERMILSNSSGDPILLQRDSWQEATTDITPLCPDSGNGTWNELVTDYARDVVISSGNWDGVFWDSLYNAISWKSDEIDLDEDGIADDPTWLNQQWKAGMDEFYQLAREKMGYDLIMIGNGRHDQYNYSNGMMIELFDNRPWIAQYDYTLNWESNSIDPSYNIIVAMFDTSNPSYRYRRFVFGTALLTNAHYEIANNAYTDTWWLDEFAVDGGEAILPTSENNYKGKFYLGKALIDSYEDTDGFYRRDFENGIVLVNPTTSSKTITLEEEYRKILGTQDPYINDGSIVLEIILNPLESIILLRI